MALASDLGDVEPCRIDVLQRIQYVGGTRVVCRELAVDFLHSFGTVLADPVTLGQAGGPSCAKAMGAGEDLLVLFPCMGGAFDQKHGFEAPSVHDGEAELTVADPSDLQHVSDEVLEDSMASLPAARVALVRRAHTKLREHSGSQALLRTARPPSLTAFYSKGSRRPRCRNLSARVKRQTPIFHGC